jgi:hypothetical protein
VLGESFCRCRNDPRLIVLLQVAEPFGIGAAMVAHFVTTLLDALNYIRIVLTDKVLSGIVAGSFSSSSARKMRQLPTRRPSAEARLVNPTSHKSRAERATWLVLAVRQGAYDAQRLFQKPPCLQIRLITRDWLG